MRTRLRPTRRTPHRPFLSSNAQDFIEERKNICNPRNCKKFLSSNAQDFIEDVDMQCGEIGDGLFLSRNAQDFMEED